MKKFLLLISSAGMLGALIGGCQKPAATNNDQEIERRVQGRLAEEHQAEQQKQLDDQAAQLKQKEQELADQQKALEAQQAQAQTVAEVQPTPVPDASSDDADDVPPPATNASFYDALSPYGSWLQIPGISGYVWQPFIAEQDPRWRPYQRGHWAYTDQGWTWISDEQFGWATYHYGRWEQLDGTGWVWMPGQEWAPAWVSWRSGDDYVGWAPLPPENGTVIAYDSGYDYAPADYSFVPLEHFCEPVIVNYIVAAQYNTTIINKTVNISKIVRRNKDQHIQVFNPGPPPKQIADKTHRPIKPLKILASMGRGAVLQKGNALQVVAPPVPPANQALPRPANVQQVQRPVRANRPLPQQNGTIERNPQRPSSNPNSAQPLYENPPEINRPKVQRPGQQSLRPQVPNNAPALQSQPPVNQTQQQQLQRLLRQQERARQQAQPQPNQPAPAAQPTQIRQQEANPAQRAQQQSQIEQRQQQQENRAQRQEAQAQAAARAAARAEAREERQQNAAPRPVPPAAASPQADGGKAGNVKGD
jgi:hypothetical protein